jgi:hypothetical protein
MLPVLCTVSASVIRASVEGIEIDMASISMVHAIIVVLKFRSFLIFNYNFD